MFRHFGFLKTFDHHRLCSFVGNFVLVQFNNKVISEWNRMTGKPRIIWRYWCQIINLFLLSEMVKFSIWYNAVVGHAQLSLGNQWITFHSSSNGKQFCSKVDLWGRTLRDCRYIYIATNLINLLMFVISLKSQRNLWTDMLAKCGKVVIQCRVHTVVGVNRYLKIMS